MRNRRGSEKECSQNFWGEENPRKSLQFLGPSEPFPPPARGVLCSFTPVSLLPAAPHPPAAGQGSGLQLLGQRGTGCERCSAALTAKNPPRASPPEGSGNTALLYLQKWGLLPGETAFFGFLLYLHIRKFSHFTEKWCRHLRRLFLQETEPTIFL